jgi:hypothetical protein
MDASPTIQAWRVDVVWMEVRSSKRGVSMIYDAKLSHPGMEGRCYVDGSPVIQAWKVDVHGWRSGHPRMQVDVAWMEARSSKLRRQAKRIASGTLSGILDGLTRIVSVRRGLLPRRRHARGRRACARCPGPRLPPPRRAVLSLTRDPEATGPVPAGCSPDAATAKTPCFVDSDCNKGTNGRCMIFPVPPGVVSEALAVVLRR